MRIKLAGSTGKRTFSVIRYVRNKPDFVPCHITSTLAKADAFALSKNLSSEDRTLEWKSFVLLDDGDWYQVSPEFRNFYREEGAAPISVVNTSNQVN